MSSDTAQGPSDEQKAAVVERILRGEISAEDACREQGLTEAELKEWVGAYRRTTRRALESKLTAQLTARGLPSEEAPSSEFSGSLESMALAELIQTIAYGRKDAQIRVEHDGEQSQIWCEQGEVVDARAGRLAGSGAVYRLLSLRNGRVYADFSRAPRARTIHASTPALLLEAAKRYDECRKLRDRIGDTSVTYVVSPHAWDAEARLPPDTWRLLRAFDGVSSVEAVLAASVSPELETLTGIAGLLEQGLITVRPAPTAPQWLPLATQPDAPSERSVLPFAASLRARLSQPGSARPRFWVSALAGTGVVAVAFVIGFWSVRRDVLQKPPRPPAAASAGDWAATRAGACPDGMARVEGGLLFGTEPSAAAPASPEPLAAGSREPRLPAFCLSRLEATVAEYEACVAANGCEPAEREYDLRLANRDPAAGSGAVGLALQCNSGQAGRERYPINCVNFQQAQQFCSWRGGRLPSQAEWEYAAEQVNPDPGEAHRGTLPVGSFPAGGNPAGVLDLFGNVSEWTSGNVGLRSAGDDSGRRQLYTVLGGGAAPGPSRIGARASRVFMSANARGRNVGFRCAFELPTGS